MLKINPDDIYDKNLNFLIGSGASVGLLPTLTLKLQNTKTDKSWSFEELATHFKDNPYISGLLFSWYTQQIIMPAASFENKDLEEEKKAVFENYKTFLETILTMIRHKQGQKTANIFTTNYDSLICHAAENMLRTSNPDFVLNDGGSGFIQRTLFAKNFNRFYRDQGVFNRYHSDVAQINLIQLHGSVYWYNQNENIEISYDKERAISRINAVPLRTDKCFETILTDDTQTETDLDKSFDKDSFDFLYDTDSWQDFWKAYECLPIVNPTKWKFHETVFEEHYYQMLRLLNYELEKPDTIFITFGFSFADEHILNLVKRSLSNPTLQLFICCFNSNEEENMKAKFKGFQNIEFITTESDLDFTEFNNTVFSTSIQSKGRNA